MIQAISPQDRRALTRGAAILAGVLIVGWGAPSVHRWRESNAASVEVLRQRYVRASTAAHRLPALRGRLHSVRLERSRAGSLLLGGITASAAQAELAGLVATAAGDAGALLGPIDISSDTSGQLLTVEVRGSVAGNLQTIAFFLAVLEVGPEILVVRELGVVRSEGIQADGSAQSLRAEFVVRGMSGAGTRPIR